MTLAQSRPSGYVVGAYGLHWDRDEVTWNPGQGTRATLLGRRGEKPTTFCDFRRAAGIYLLSNEYRVTYVGLARSRDGLFTRLAKHHNDETKQWSRFSWFSVDDVERSEDYDGWAETYARRTMDGLNDVGMVMEMEALLILAVGSHTLRGQRRMSFQEGEEWKQVTLVDYLEGGLARKVAPEPLDQERRRITEF